MNIILTRNASWASTITLRDGGTQEPFPLADYTTEMALRDSAASPTAAPALVLTTQAGSGLAYTDVDGQLVMSMTEAQVNALPFAQGTYQLKVTTLDGQYSAILLGGSVFIKPV
jgi:hypothetical protein